MNVFLQTCAIASQRPYAKPSAKKFLKQQFFRYCFITGARSRTPGVFHVNVFSSSYIVLLYMLHPTCGGKSIHFSSAGPPMAAAILAKISSTEPEPLMRRYLPRSM